MAWTYVSEKDGTVMKGIPDDVKEGDPIFLEELAKIRAQAGKPADQSQLPEWAQKIEGERNLVMQIPGAQSAYDGTREVSSPEGMAGGVIRGAGPQAAMTSIHPALGAIYGTTMAGMDALTPFVNSGLKSLGAPEWLQQATPSEGLEWIMTKVGIPEPKTATERILQSIASGAAGAKGMASGAASIAKGEGMAQTATKGIAERLALAPEAQVAGGMGSAGAGQAAAEAGADPWTQLAASIAGSGAAGLATQRQQAFPKAMETADADRAGIRVLTSDVFPPRSPGAKLAQTLTERNPFFGTGPVRAAQQTERVDAVRSLLREYGADDAAASSDAVMSDLLAKRSADLGKWTKAKDEVIDRLADVGGEVPVPKTIAKIDEEIAKLKGMKLEKVQPIISDLEDFKTAVQGQDLRNVEELRRQLGESYKSPDMASVRSTGEKALSSIYGPLREEMGAFIRDKGIAQDAFKWTVANKELSTMMGELDMTALKSTLKNGDATPEVIQRMLFSKKPSEIKELYSGLTAEGRANARSAILAKAAEDSISAGTDTISPEKFSSAVKKLGNSVGVFFTGDDLDRVEGLTRALNLTKRAAEATANPQTGIQTLIPLSGIGAASAFGGGLPGFLGAMATGAGVGGLTRIYESPAVRDLLVKLAKTNTNSEAEARLFNQLAGVIRAQEVKASGEKVSASDKARAAQGARQ